MIGAAIGSAVIGASSANKASKAQERAANNQLALEKQVYDDTTQRFEPYNAAGLDYSNALRYELLGGEKPTFGGNQLTVEQFTDTTRPEISAENALRMFINPRDGESFNAPATTSVQRFRVGDQVFDDRALADQYANDNSTPGQEYQGFQATPGYQFALNEGQRAIDASAASRGSLFSGATLKAQQQYGTGLANQEYGTYLNRLTGGAASGQAAAGNQATAGSNYAQGAGNAYAGMGNAQAAGAIGVGNAFTSGIGNVAGIWNYQKAQGGNQNRLFGGNAWG